MWGDPKTAHRDGLSPTEQGHRNRNRVTVRKHPKQLKWFIYARKINNLTVICVSLCLHSQQDKYHMQRITLRLRYV